jgi:virginiamycin B lyase
MSRFSLLTAVILLFSCSDHSALPPPASISRQVFQKQPFQGYWLKTKLPSVSYPADLTVDTKADVWVTDSGLKQLSRVSMRRGVKSFPLTFAPQAIVLGSDNNLWVSSSQPGGIVARVTSEGVESDFTVGLIDTKILSMAEGSDGAVWFTELNSQSESGIGRIDTSGFFTFYPVNGGAGEILNGPDGNLWFGSNFNICTMNTQGQIIAQYPFSDQLYGDTVGPDGALWFTGYGYLLRVTTTGVMTQYAAPVTGLYDVTSANASLWMTQRSQSGDGLISFDTKSQTFGNLMPSPTFLRRVITGRDGNLWMTGPSASIATYINQVLSVTPTILTLQLGPQSGNTATLTVGETNYSGTWSAEWPRQIVNVVQTSPGVFSVTAVGRGMGKVTIKDTMHNSTKIPVTVE